MTSFGTAGDGARRPGRAVDQRGVPADRDSRRRAAELGAALRPAPPAAFARRAAPLHRSRLRPAHRGRCAAARAACPCPRRWRRPPPAPGAAPASRSSPGSAASIPALRVHVLDKTVLLAVTRAIEDECGARAQRPVLLGSFQRQRFYQASAARWADLARTAEQTVVFADFGRSRLRPGRSRRSRFPRTRPLRREWALICDAPDTPACVAAWERPGQDQRRDRDRIFEVLWSVDPQVVRTAARIGIGLAAAAIPELPERLSGRLSEDPGPSSADLRRASGLIERTLDYLAGASRPGPGLTRRGPRGPRRFIHGGDDRPAVRPGPCVRAQTSRVAGVVDGGAADEYRHGAVAAPDGLNGGLDRAVAAWSDGPDDHGDQAGHVPGGFGEGSVRRVRAEVDDLEPFPAEQIGDDGAGQAVLVPGRGTDDHHAALPAPAGELGAQPPDYAQGHRRGSVLGRDGHRAVGPGRTHAGQHGHQQVEVNLSWLHPRGQGVIDDAPGAGFVTGGHPRGEAGRPVLLRPGAAGGSRRAGRAAGAGPVPGRVDRPATGRRRAGREAGQYGRTGTRSCSERPGGWPLPAS